MTRREIEILQLVAERRNHQAIASRLFVSDHTIHRHVANILNKLDGRAKVNNSLHESL